MCTGLHTGVSYTYISIHINIVIGNEDINIHVYTHMLIPYSDTCLMCVCIHVLVYSLCCMYMCM